MNKYNQKQCRNKRIYHFYCSKFSNENFCRLATWFANYKECSELSFDTLFVKIRCKDTEKWNVKFANLRPHFLSFICFANVYLLLNLISKTKSVFWSLKGWFFLSRPTSKLCWCPIENFKNYYCLFRRHQNWAVGC